MAEASNSADTKPGIKSTEWWGSVGAIGTLSYLADQAIAAGKDTVAMVAILTIGFVMLGYQVVRSKAKS